MVIVRNFFDIEDIEDDDDINDWIPATNGINDSNINSNYQLLSRIPTKEGNEVWEVREISTDKVYIYKKFTQGNIPYDKLIKIDHPCIPKIKYYNKVNDEIYIIEEKIKGQTLDKFERVFSIDEILLIGIEVCKALIELHSYGIDHRDIKPTNIIYDDESNRVVLIDYDASRENKFTVTIPMGSFGYEAPEIGMLSKLDHRVDIYSLGATLHDFVVKLEASSKIEYPVVHDIINKCIERDREKRYNSVEELLECFNKINKNPSLTIKKLTPECYKMSDVYPDIYMTMESVPDKLDISELTDLSEMFKDCEQLRIVPDIDTANVLNMSSMFEGCYSLRDIPYMDTSQVTNMTKMFCGCSSLKNIHKFDTGNLLELKGMFKECTYLQYIHHFDTKKVTCMDELFSGCNFLEEVPKFATSNVRSMEGMFIRCEKIKTVPKFQTHNVENMKYMFSGCISLETIPCFNTQKVETMKGMFRECHFLKEIPALLVNNVNNFSFMFKNCINLENVNLQEINSAIDIQEMFAGCKSLVNIPEIPFEQINFKEDVFKDSNISPIVHDECDNVTSSFNKTLLLLKTDVEFDHRKLYSLWEIKSEYDCDVIVSNGEIYANIDCCRDTRDLRLLIVFGLVISPIISFSRSRFNYDCSKEENPHKSDFYIVKIQAENEDLCEQIANELEYKYCEIVLKDINNRINNFRKNETEKIEALKKMRKDFLDYHKICSEINLEEYYTFEIFTNENSKLDRLKIFNEEIARFSTINIHKLDDYKIIPDDIDFTINDNSIIIMFIDELEDSYLETIRLITSKAEKNLKLLFVNDDLEDDIGKYFNGIMTIPTFIPDRELNLNIAKNTIERIISSIVSKNNPVTLKQYILMTNRKQYIHAYYGCDEENNSYSKAMENAVSNDSFQREISKANNLLVLSVYDKYSLDSEYYSVIDNFMAKNKFSCNTHINTELAENIRKKNKVVLLALCDK